MPSIMPLIVWLSLRPPLGAVRERMLLKASLAPTNMKASSAFGSTDDTSLAIVSKANVLVGIILCSAPLGNINFRALGWFVIADIMLALVFLLLLLLLVVIVRLVRIAHGQKMI